MKRFGKLICLSVISTAKISAKKKKDNQSTSFNMDNTFTPQHATLSALPLKNDLHRESGIILLCDSASRDITALNPINGQIINEFRLKKGFLNENYPILCKQLSPTKFLFLEHQYFGSFLNDIRICEHFVLIRDLNERDVVDCNSGNKLSLSVSNDSQIVTNSSGQVVIRTKLQQGVLCRIINLHFDIAGSKNSNDEPVLWSQEVHINEPGYVNESTKMVCLPCNDNQGTFLLYFLTDDKGSFSGELATSIINYSHLKEETLIFQRIFSNPADIGFPPENLLDAFAGPFVHDDKIYFLDYNPSNKEVRIWILGFNENGSSFTWESKTLDNYCMTNYAPKSGILVINDFNECYWIQYDASNISKYSVYPLNVIHNKPSSLKRFAEKSLTLSGYSNFDLFLKPHVLSRNFEWLQKFKNDLNQNGNGSKTITIVKLKPAFFTKFCNKILNFGDDNVVKNIKIQQLKESKFEVIFNNSDQKRVFLERCRSIEEQSLNIMAPVVVEIYENNSHLYTNQQPIFISLPVDFDI